MIRFTQNIRLFCCILPNLSRQSNLFEILSGDPSPARAQCTEMQRAAHFLVYQTRRQYLQFSTSFLKLKRYVYLSTIKTRRRLIDEKDLQSVALTSSVYTNFSITPPIYKVCAPAACTGHGPDMRQTIKE